MTLLADIYDEFMVARQTGDQRALNCFTEVFLSHPKVEKERDPMRLFASDIGKCPRQVGYRLLSTERDPQSHEKQRNDQRMFDIAEFMEAMMTAAFMWKGQLIGYQIPVPFSEYGRENWGGRIDMAVDMGGKRRIIEYKTHRGNASNYDLPKVPHAHQANVYDMMLTEELGLTDLPIAAYFSRDGSGEPQEYRIECWDDATNALMDELEEARINVDEGGPEGLWAKAPKTLKLRSRGKQVVQEPDWQCQYCDYALTCEPLTGKSLWAECGDGIWDVKRAADAEQLAAWAVEWSDAMLVPLRVA